jgi:hypothetical protein
MPFETNVFINCPFDSDFKKILHPMLFTIIYHGLKPRIATERIDSGEQRISKIIELIKESKWSIHDLSRVKATNAGEIFRLNMPYELGIDVGCRRFGSGKLALKQYLVTASEHYEYQKALSDIAGTDIAVHGDDALQAVRVVRQWIENVIGGEDGSQAIWAAYEDFNASMFDEMSDRGFDTHEIENVQTAKLIKLMEKFIAERKLRKANGSSVPRESSISTVPLSRLAGDGRSLPLAKSNADEEMKRRKELAAKAKIRRMAAGSPY